jgi:heme-degrading monooxygenase HmoA
MFVLHVGIEVKPDHEQAMESDFLGPFTAAISAQEGFVAVALLRPNEVGDYLLSISFESRSFQQEWVTTELHSEVWSMMERHFARHTLSSYTAV